MPMTKSEFYIQKNHSNMLATNEYYQQEKEHILNNDIAQ